MPSSYKRRWLIASSTLFTKMKFVILAATILACAIGKQKSKYQYNAILVLTFIDFTFALHFTATPSTRLVMPRLPLKVLLSGKFQMIPEDKIVGGVQVAPNSLPFQVSLQRRGLLANSAVIKL
jgi:trypsin